MHCAKCYWHGIIYAEAMRRAKMQIIFEAGTTKLCNATAVFVYLGMKHYEEKKDKRHGNSF